MGGINGTGQVPLISNFPSLIDTDTPDSAKTRTGFDGNDDWELVFSDEFNKDGRTFFDGGESDAASCERKRARASRFTL